MLIPFRSIQFPHDVLFITCSPTKRKIDTKPIQPLDWISLTIFDSETDIVVSDIFSLTAKIVLFWKITFCKHSVLKIKRRRKKMCQSEGKDFSCSNPNSQRYQILVLSDKGCFYKENVNTCYSKQYWIKYYKSNNRLELVASMGKCVSFLYKYILVYVSTCKFI